MKNVIFSIVAVLGFAVAAQAGTEYTRTYQRQGHGRTVQVYKTVEQTPTTRHRCRCGKHCQCPNCPCKKQTQQSQPVPQTAPAVSTSQ